jgi:hypothetical protein
LPKRSTDVLQKQLARRFVESSPERRISAIVAIVGSDEALAGALERALRDRGATVVMISTERLIEAAPPHDLAVLIGSAAHDGGEALITRMRADGRKVAVVLYEAALAERLVAHRCGASVVLRGESAPAMAHDIARIVKGEASSELGWTSLNSLVELLRQSIATRLAVDPAARAELLLGDPDAVRAAIESFADELGVLALTSRAGAGPSVIVEDPAPQADPQAPPSTKVADRWYDVAAPIEALTPLQRPPPLPPSPRDEILEFDPPFGTALDEKLVSAPSEPVSASATSLADLLEPDYVVEIEVPPSDAPPAPDDELYDELDFSEVTPVKSLAAILAAEPRRASDRPTAIPPPMPELSEASTPTPLPPRLAAHSHASSPSTPPPPIARHVTGSSPSDAPPPMTKRVPASSPSDGPPPMTKRVPASSPSDGPPPMTKRTPASEPRSKDLLSRPSAPSRADAVAAPADARRTPWGGIAIGAAATVALVLLAVIALGLVDPDDEPREGDAPAAVAAGGSEDVEVPTDDAPAVAEPGPAVEDDGEPEDARELATTPAIVLERQGRWEEARAAWDVALAADPNDPHALAGLARERIHAEDAEGAIRFAERAANLRRRRAYYRVLLGDAHALAGNEGEARAHYEAALALEPGYPAAQARLAQ